MLLAAPLDPPLNPAHLSRARAAQGVSGLLHGADGLGWMLIYVYYVTVYPAVQDVVEPGLRATAMALYFFAMYLLGGSFGSMIVGMLSDHFALRAALTEAGIILTDAKLVPPEFRARLASGVLFGSK